MKDVNTVPRSSEMIYPRIIGNTLVSDEVSMTWGGDTIKKVGGRCRGCGQIFQCGNQREAIALLISEDKIREIELRTNELCQQQIAKLPDVRDPQREYEWKKASLFIHKEKERMLLDSGKVEVLKDFYTFSWDRIPAHDHPKTGKICSGGGRFSSIGLIIDKISGAPLNDDAHKHLEKILPLIETGLSISECYNGACSNKATAQIRGLNCQECLKFRRDHRLSNCEVLRKVILPSCGDENCNRVLRELAYPYVNSKFCHNPEDYEIEHLLLATFAVA